jgi:hypothetical protein
LNSIAANAQWIRDRPSGLIQAIAAPDNAAPTADTS